MYRRGALLLLLSLPLLSLPLIAQVPFNEFVVFGDSLSDNGNLYAGTVAFGLPPTPGPPLYATGEYTDGINSVPSTTGPLGLWIEQLAQKMNLPVPQPFKKGGTNYAVASALTGTNPGFSLSAPSVPYLTDQLNLFLAANPKPPSNALYAFWGGANDILNGGSAATAAANVQANIDTLATAGAKYFLWVNQPPLGEIPESITTPNRAALDAASVTYNQAWSSAIAQLKASHSGITIVTIDAYSLFELLAQSPAAYGLTNVTSPAQSVSGINPNTYLFWDQLHPTTVGHNFVATVGYSMLESAFGGTAYSCTNTTTPVITSVNSASAYGAYSYFASGSYLEIRGTNLADPDDPRLLTATAGQWTANDFNGLNAPTMLDGISASIDGKPAYVSYISPDQINVQAPEDATTGNVAIAVTNCKAPSSPFTFAKHALAPGLLAPASFNISGTQYMVATFSSDGAYVLNTAAGAGLGLNSRPAKAGDLIIAYGVGFGDVTPLGMSGVILPGVIVEQSNAVNDPVKVSFGAVNATVVYAGLAGNFVGLYEFYIAVPSGLANGDYQINVTQNGVALPQTMYLTVGN
jgi:uncharacterized protein (TIGR03437 family)